MLVHNRLVRRRLHTRVFAGALSLGLAGSWYATHANHATATVRATQPFAAAALPWERPRIADSNYPIPTGSLFVATNGNDANPGTLARPLRTVTRAISRSHALGTIVLRGGTYRESLGSVHVGVRIQAYPHEQPWIKGSLVVGGFTQSGSAWFRPFTSPLCDTCYAQGGIDPHYPNAGLAEQVFANGTPLNQVTNRALLRPGRFFYDRNAHQLWIGSSPVGRTVEVTVHDRAALFTASATGAALKGIGIAHFGSHYNFDLPSMVMAAASNMVIDRTTFAWSATRGLSLYGANDIVTGSTFVNNGMNGVHSYQTKHLLFRGDRVAHSNFEHFSIAMSAQGSVAGAKMTMGSGGTYSGNIFADNQSNGLWLDVSSSNNVIVNNTSVRNSGAGIDIEISANTIAAGNMIAYNGYDGLKISGANNVEAWNNTIFANAWAQLGVYEDPRRNPPANIRALGVTWDTTNVRVANNVIVAGPFTAKPVLTSFDLTSPHHATTSSMIVAQDHNIWGRTFVAGLRYLASVQATLTKSGVYNTLAAMQQATHRETASRSVDGLATSSIFVNAGLDDLRLAGACPKPTVATLPSAVATAMGVSVHPTTVGALKAPHA